jgi:two-component sensor histidine kinase
VAHHAKVKMAAAVQRLETSEARRLAAIRRYDILDTPPDGSFDRITAIAADLFSVPISIISLVDHDRIWFKSHHGLGVAQIDREPGLCASAILGEGPFLLTDAKHDVRSLANPLVAGDFGLRFYLGVPLRTHDGFNLGTLCVIAQEPRTVSERQIAQLEHLASVVMDQMELRLAARKAVSELSQVVTQKEAALHRAELMKKEIDHRVMNSLQLISGLLSMQGRAFGDSEASGALAVAAHRVSAIAQVHRHIYMSEDVAATECKGYLERLCRDLSGMLQTRNRGDIVVEGIETEIPTERIVPLGLIINELVTNAVKHGAGRITVSLGCTASGDCSLSVSDEGGGLPAGFDPASARGLGMRVVHSLVQQLGGQLLAGNAEGSRGAKFSLLFPRSGAPKAS